MFEKILLKCRGIRSRIVILMYKIAFSKRLEIGEKVRFRKGVVLVIAPSGKIHIGNNVFFNCYSSVNALKEVIICDNCLFGENVHIYDHNHKYRDYEIPIDEQGYKIAPVYIGNNTWVGSNVTILQGVHVGSNCVIGANCVIHEDIPDGTVVMQEQSYRKFVK